MLKGVPLRKFTDSDVTRRKLLDATMKHTRGGGGNHGSADIIRGSGGGGCFIFGSLVETSDGPRPIEDIKKGDKVWGYDDKGKQRLQTVEELHVHSRQDGYEVQDFHFWGSSIGCTPDHWFQNQFGTFAEVGRLVPGDDACIDLVGHLRPLKAVDNKRKVAKVYNLTVLPDHTYIVGFLRVHNGARGPVIHGAGGGGSKGGGGGGSTPIEDPNTLQSYSIASVIDLVSEGPIKGLVNGPASIYLDNTPLASGTSTLTAGSTIQGNVYANNDTIYNITGDATSLVLGEGITDNANVLPAGTVITGVTLPEVTLSNNATISVASDTFTVSFVATSVLVYYDGTGFRAQATITDPTIFSSLVVGMAVTDSLGYMTYEPGTPNTISAIDTVNNVVYINFGIMNVNFSNSFSEMEDLTFSSTVNFTGNVTAGNPNIMGFSSTVGLVAGMTLTDTGGAIPSGTTVLSISSLEITLSQPATTYALGDIFNLAGFTNYNYNFSGVTWVQNLGTPDQPYLSGYPNASDTIAVGAQLTYAIGGVSRTLTNPNINSVTITFETPVLSYLDPSSGNLHGSAVEYDILVQGSGMASPASTGPYTINGKTDSPYNWDVGVDLTPYGTAPWTITCTRITGDPTTANTNNLLYWIAYTETANLKLQYPDSAIIGTTVNTLSFGTAVPGRSFEIDGMLLQVPANYDPLTRTYSGAWDGTFITAFTNNPAWILYGLLANTRWGLGQFIDVEAIDIWGLYTIAQYCDEMVSDGFGGQEPRFQFNGILNTGEDAYKVLAAITSMFRGMVYWSSGTIFCSQDSPADVERIFTPANVVNGKFTYTGTPVNTRHSAAQVTWNDPNQNYMAVIEVVEDPALIQLYGYHAMDVVSVGTTSRGQARRYGQWLLNVEKYLTQTVTFNAALDTVDCVPGTIIAVADPSYAGVRYGGRITSSPVVGGSSTSFTIDNPGDLSGASLTNAYVYFANGNCAYVPIGSIGVGPNATLTLNYGASDWDGFPPVEGSVYILVSGTVEPVTYRVLNVTEKGPNNVEVVSLLYYEDLFTETDDLQSLPPNTFQNVPTSNYVIPPGPITVTQQISNSPQGQSISLNVSWQASPDTYLKAYHVFYQDNGGTWVDMGTTTQSSMTIPNVTSGSYAIRVSAINVNTYSSLPQTTTYVVAAEDSVPVASITGLQLTNADNANGTEFPGQDAKFSWNYNSPLGATDVGILPGDAGYVDSSVAGYQIIITDDAGDTLRTTTVTTAQFTYTHEMNLEDSALFGYTTAQRQFTISVSVVDVYGRIGNAQQSQTLTVQNPAPELPIVSVSGTGATNSITMTYSPGGLDNDFAGVIVWASTSSGFTPSAANIAYQGPDTTIIFPATAGDTYYYYYAAYDMFGTDALNVSNQGSVVVALVTGGMIAPNALSLESLSDVAATGAHAPSDGQALEWNSTDGKWEPTTLATPSTTLAGDTDVTITSPADGDRLHYQTSGAKWVNGREPFYISAYSGNVNVLITSQVIVRFTAPVAINFLANFSGSYLTAEVAATGSVTINIDKAAAASPNTFSNIGTISISASGVTGTFASSGGSAENLAVGDVIRIVGPSSADATLSGISLSLAGSR